MTHHALFVQLDSPPRKSSPVDEQAAPDKIGMHTLRDTARIQQLHRAAFVVGGRRELQRAQQRLKLIARCGEDLLSDLPVDEIEAEIRRAVRHRYPNTTGLVLPQTSVVGRTPNTYRTWRVPGNGSHLRGK